MPGKQCDILCMRKGEVVMEKHTNENEKENKKKSNKTEKTTRKERKRKSKKENANGKLEKWLERL